MNLMVIGTGKAVLLAAVGGFGLYMFYKTVFYVRKTQRALIFHKLRGVADRVVEPGFHLCHPFLEVSYRYCNETPGPPSPPALDPS